MLERKKTIYNVLIFGILCFLCFGIGRAYYRMTDDFTMRNITYDFPLKEEWSTPLPNEGEMHNLKHILQQTFTYIGKGAQSFAFMSEDGKYVIKFFKFKHLRPSPILSFLPPVKPFEELKSMDLKRKSRKFNSVFTGYKVAFDFHRNGSGIIYAHLNQTQGLWNHVTVKDKLGFKRKIALDQVSFVIQNCAIKTRDMLQTYFKNNDIEGVKRSIRKIFDSYTEEYSKGLHDRDHGVIHNTGFVGDRVIHLDVGKFERNDTIKNETINKYDLTIIAWKFSVWIKENYPMYHQEIVKDMEKKLEEIYHDRIIIPEKMNW